MQGKIRKIIRERGFGFIRTEKGDVFFHRSALRELDFHSLQEGDDVEFEMVLGEKGLTAVSVRQRTCSQGS
jgi:cold shock protein